LKGDGVEALCKKCHQLEEENGRLLLLLAENGIVSNSPPTAGWLAGAWFFRDVSDSGDDGGATAGGSAPERVLQDRFDALISACFGDQLSVPPHLHRRLTKRRYRTS
jgi:hypothetical protein